MSAVLLYTGLAVLVGVVIAFLSFYKSKKEKDADRPRAPRPRPAEEGGARPAQPPNRVAANRNARARMRAAAQRHAGGDSEEEEEEEAALGENIALPDGKVGKKKLAKLQAKADKRVQREMEEREREERKERKEREDEERKKEEEKEAEEEARKEEEERKAREEKERQEQEEYLRLKAEFQVEEEGFQEHEDEEEKEKNLLNNFVSHIKDQKVLVLEDLAAKFKLKTQDVISRVTDLQKQGILTGVLDDRGKFIYISREELEGVAKFIKQRGRVSLAELAENSASLITLTPETPPAS
ncbi:hypothetical protein O3P69_019563 [Scylla paramamosain]|uniref:DDRGK domain-containing protein 1 n=1 Tax=Scylla paramamosain TaxID=85552 RepID=A0AAW0SXR8_SCYPA